MLTLAKLLEALQDELKGHEERRSWHEREFQELRTKIESKQRALELVEATFWEVVNDVQEYFEGVGPGASTQVRGSNKPQDMSRPCGPATWAVSLL
jgi:chromosome segregation ATPase